MELNLKISLEKEYLMLNKHNLQYFESSSMRELYESIQNWQNENQKRLLSMSIQNDDGKFCCIALTNPSEVVIVAKVYPESSYEEIYRRSNSLCTC